MTDRRDNDKRYSRNTTIADRLIASIVKQSINRYLTEVGVIGDIKKKV